MKTKILYLFFVLTLLLSCNEDEDPQVIDPFVGQWNYKSLNAAADLEMTFDVVKREDKYVLENVLLDYTVVKDIPFTTYTISTWHKFADGSGGFGGIQIDALNEKRTAWIAFKLKYNTFSSTKGEPVSRMKVDEFEVVNVLSGAVLVKLQNQLFYKL